ncbi:PLDc N-terminal domain-containing protein [Asanoa sp. NPDC049573]|uniref:PLDc N-terminal domain-containing protein n=1 Tax=Asanoa sp. NPDC049573 TaxID=3155396 RepID=UPI00342A141D
MADDFETGPLPQAGLREFWAGLGTARRAGVVTLAAFEVVCTTAAALDLLRRPQHLVRGPKALWWPALFVQPVGSIAYLTWGRRLRTSTDVQP